MTMPRQGPRTRERRFGLRGRGNLALGIGIGAVLGAGIGIALGAWAFGWGSGGMWTAMLAGVLFGVLLGAFEGGMSSLESPAPGSEPLESEHPVRDVPELTDTERPKPRTDVER